MRTLTSCVVLGLLPMAAQGEIITGDIVNVSGDYFFDGLSLGMWFTGWHHNDVSYSVLEWTNESYAQQSNFMSHPVNGTEYSLGDEIRPGHDRSGSLGWGSSSMFKGEYSHDNIGTVGETFYLGFTFVRSEDGMDDAHLYGFIQIEKLSEVEYNWVGYAYNDEHGQTIETFDLIPSPSGLAVFGFGGLLATRRRR